jgi:hypothetical protein
MSHPVKSAARVVDIVELVSQKPVGSPVAEIRTKPGIARTSTRGLAYMAARGSLSRGAAAARGFVLGGPFVQLGTARSASSSAFGPIPGSACGVCLALDEPDDGRRLGLMTPRKIGVCRVGGPIYGGAGRLVAAARLPPIREYYRPAETGPALCDAAVGISRAMGWARDRGELYRLESAVPRPSGGGKESIFSCG